jgi:hypothetical protein
MNSNAVVIALCSLSLGATCYLVASMPKGNDERIAALEAKLDAAEKRAAAVESVRVEVHELTQKVERRMAAVDQRVAEAGPATGFVAERGGVTALPGAAPAGDGSSAGKPLEELVADRVERKVSEKLDAMASRDRERGEDGKWKAPLDDLSQELKLTDAQKADAKRIFEHSRDEAFTLLKTQRLDGGSILDDYAAALKSGADATETTKQLFNRIISEHVPGSDQTYLSEFIAMHQSVQEALAAKLDAGQMKRLNALRVDLLDVKTGYDPVGDYVRAKLQ